VAEDELPHLLALLLSRGAGRRVIRRVAADTWRQGGTVIEATARLRRKFGVATPTSDRVRVEAAAIDRLRLRVIRLDDPEYPELVSTIPDPPLAIFVLGSASALVAPLSVAIVGSRRASASGRQLARSLAADLGRAGLGVISGLAVGIDAAAHRGAIEGGAKTVAVIGGGHQHIYPAQHRSLVAEIVSAGGAVISEYPPTIEPRRGHFPERNRIISGLAAGTVVVEATVKSGSLITARMALEQGREVMAVPGPVLGGDFGGCHRLIRQGAVLVEDAADILQGFGLAVPIGDAPAAPADPMQARVLAAMRGTSMQIHELVEKLDVPVQQLLGALVALELDGFVESDRDGYIRRPRSTGKS
jgi:DNA processing protein